MWIRKHRKSQRILGNRKRTETGGQKAGIGLIILAEPESEQLRQGAAIY
jgi:hypothetical protein